ncbi:MAG: outer membrane protein assembly factor BamD [Bacteroidales bacterium]|nr:outer membrane protein assembly factor BamD [Candidatus Colimorpha onthohippi]
MKNWRNNVIILVTIVFLYSCGGYERLLKSNDYDGKYEAAMRYYNENRFTKAIQLFENLTLHYRGKENAENISWYYAQSLYKEKDYYTAGYQFKHFTRQFPYSERTEEASYLSAYCKYMESSPYTLDQSTSKEAVKELEHFAERYPQSVHIPEVNTYLDELRDKLMKKEYEIAYGYYLIESYHAAYISMQTFINNYPESKYREDAMFYLLSAGYEYAINSTDDKIKERMQQVVNDFDKFATSFADSKRLSEAQDIYTKSKAALARLEQEGTITKK